MPAIQFINEFNKHALNKAADRNQLYYSELNEWYTENAFRSFSVKYVLDGEINYECTRKKYRVGANQILLTSKQAGAKAFFKSSQTVKSICIDVCTHSVNEAFTVLHQGDQPNLDNFSAGYFEHPHFFEQQLRLKDSLLKSLLDELAWQVNNKSDQPDSNEEWFMRLAEHLVRQEKPNFISLQAVSGKKQTTRKEILERVSRGREFMHDQFLQNPEISEVARNCNLSAFHFYRNFRNAFGVSPYQYMMKLRIDHAANLIIKKQLSLSEVALHCGFADLASFSKAFRKVKGAAPSIFLKQH